MQYSVTPILQSDHTNSGFSTTSIVVNFVASQMKHTDKWTNRTDEICNATYKNVCASDSIYPLQSFGRSFGLTKWTFTSSHESCENRFCIMLPLNSSSDSEWTSTRRSCFRWPTSAHMTNHTPLPSQMT